MSLPSLTIKSARSRLALTYLAIIMVLSISFSAVFYFQSVNEAKQNLRNQQVQLSDFLFFTTQESVQRIQDRQLGIFKSSLVRRLTVLNLGMLGLGGVVSYYLARRSLRPLEEAIVQQGRFTSDAAHELRTPLTAMKAEIEVTLRDKRMTVKDARETLKSSLEEISKLDALTSALLRLARGSEQIDKSNWQSYRVADILKAASERVADKANTRGITVKIARTKLTVFGDPDQLIELFVTLLSNAIKYSDGGSEVSVAATREESRVRVDVTDQGVGITEVDLPHIFERFYRADQSRNKTQAEGYGLGLSLAEAITKAHDGEIRVKSQYGKGSVFSVFLPRP